MNKIGITFIVLVASFFLLFGCTTTISNDKNADSGRVVFAIKDAATNMNSVTKLNMTVDSVQAYSKTKGWVTVSSTPKTYDLLELKAQNKTAVFADTTMASETYEKVRLNVSNITVVKADGEQKAYIPSNSIEIESKVKVDTNKTSTATFDFIADESLHTTSEGKFVFAPVIDVETRSNANATVQNSSSSEASVIITGGKTETKSKVGMDIEGNVGIGLGISTNVDILVTTDILGNSVISIGSSSNTDNNSGGINIVGSGNTGIEIN
ncbi:MAG: DUF4382 domain-containing protein [archaeon]|jgi:hypothetical protein